MSITTINKDLAFSHLDKILYPEAEFTKAQVIDYYCLIAPVMLPHLARRPISVQRCPDGVEGQRFFEKRCPANHPSWVHSRAVTSTRFGHIDYCLVDNEMTLLWLANRAALEMHTYLFKVPAEQTPTMVVFDLDPGAPADLMDCLDIAVILRDMLKELGLTCFAKTSGGKGLHVAVPLNRSATFAQTKAFAHGIASLLEEAESKRVTSVMSKSARPGKVFIDWSQNDHGKTTVCAYSLRVRSRPMVSAPVSWDEVMRAQRRHSSKGLLFEAGDMANRIKDVGDIFAPVLTMKQTLPAWTEGDADPASPSK